LHTRDWVPPRNNQQFARKFTKALWGHIHGTPLSCSAAANVDPPPPVSTRRRSSTVSQEPVVANGGFPACSIVTATAF
jgi:hypothetical protein